jgi:hypothetical protein
MNDSGIDLHSNNSVVTVTDEEDRVMAEKRLPNDLGRLGILPTGTILPPEQRAVRDLTVIKFNKEHEVGGP